MARDKVEFGVMDGSTGAFVGPVPAKGKRAAASFRRTGADPLRPVHPGEILREDYLIPLGFNAPRAAARMGLRRERIERIWKEEVPVTADTAMRLERFLGSSAEFWLNLQVRYDLEIARRQTVVGLEEISPAEGLGA